jgi:hypothetical protein
MANSSAITVVGGSETAEAIEQVALDSQMTHVVLQRLASVDLPVEIRVVEASTIRIFQRWQ